MGEIVRQGLHGAKARNHVEAFCKEQNIKDADRFVAMTLTDLDSLHTGAIIGLGISEAQLIEWISNRF